VASWPWCDPCATRLPRPESHGVSKIDKLCYFWHGSLMNISLTPELEKVVRERVESGLYNNASEVIREALRDSLRRERESGWLVREAAVGYAQLKSGATVEVSSKEEFKDLVRAKR